MRVIIAGGRDFTDAAALDAAIAASGFEITEVVSGRARRGADKLGEAWALAHGVPIRRFPAIWRPLRPDGTSFYDRAAGVRRNDEMARYADALIALPGGDGHRRYDSSRTTAWASPLAVVSCSTLLHYRR